MLVHLFAVYRNLFIVQLFFSDNVFTVLLNLVFSLLVCCHASIFWTTKISQFWSTNNFIFWVGRSKNGNEKDSHKLPRMKWRALRCKWREVEPKSIYCQMLSQILIVYYKTINHHSTQKIGNWRKNFHKWVIGKFYPLEAVELHNMSDLIISTRNCHQ